MKDLPRDEILLYALERVLSAPFLPFSGSGCVLAGENGGLVMLAGKGISPGLARRAGEAAERFASRDKKPLEGTEIVKIAGAGPALLSPFAYRGELLGFLLLFLKRKTKIYLSEEEKEFVSAVSNLIAGIITRKNSEKAAAAVRKELRGAKRLSEIGALAAAVAHELRSPLAVIKMAASNIRKKTGGGNIESHLSSIETKVFECDRIISNLLFYAKLKEPRLEKTDLYDIILQSISETKKVYGAGAAAVKRNIRRVKNVCVEIDPVQFKEVLTNIILNAFQAMEGKEGQVTVRAEIDGSGRTAVSVEDEGEGIDREAAGRIFSPFWTTKPKGNGLGLTVAESIVKLHGGAIGVESKKGKGSIFRVVLPAQKNDEEN